MNGAEFVRCAKRYAGKAGKDFRFHSAHGKGSHGRLHIGNRFTTVKRSEIAPGLLRAMLKQLGIDRKDF